MLSRPVWSRARQLFLLDRVSRRFIQYPDKSREDQGGAFASDQIALCCGLLVLEQLLESGEGAEALEIRVIGPLARRGSRIRSPGGAGRERGLWCWGRGGPLSAGPRRRRRCRAGEGWASGPDGRHRAAVAISPRRPLIQARSSRASRRLGSFLTARSASIRAALRSVRRSKRAWPRCAAAWLGWRSRMCRKSARAVAGSASIRSIPRASLGNGAVGSFSIKPERISRASTLRPHRYSASARAAKTSGLGDRV